MFHLAAILIVRRWCAYFGCRTPIQEIQLLFGRFGSFLTSFILYGSLICIALCHIAIFVSAMKHRIEMRRHFPSDNDMIVREMFKKALMLFLIVILFWTTWAFYLAVYFRRTAILRRKSILGPVTVPAIFNPFIILKGNRLLREGLKKSIRIYPGNVQGPTNTNGQ